MLYQLIKLNTHEFHISLLRKIHMQRELGPKSNHNMDLLMKTVIFDKQLKLIMIEIWGAHTHTREFLVGDACLT